MASFNRSKIGEKDSRDEYFLSMSCTLIVLLFHIVKLKDTFEKNDVL